MLATNCLAFGGHTDRIDDLHNDNFLSMVKLAEFDPIWMMHKLLNRPSGSVKYVRTKIQNKLIETLGNELEAQLVNNIKNAPFYSIITDTTQDISTIDQLSQTFRYAEIMEDDNGSLT